MNLKKIAVAITLACCASAPVFAVEADDVVCDQCVDSVDIAKSAVKAENIKKSTIKSKQIKNGSLLAEDFAANQIAKSINGLKDDVMLYGSPTISITEVEGGLVFNTVGSAPIFVDCNEDPNALVNAYQANKDSMALTFNISGECYGNYTQGFYPPRGQQVFISGETPPAPELPVTLENSEEVTAEPFVESAIIPNPDFNITNIQVRADGALELLNVSVELSENDEPILVQDDATLVLNGGDLMANNPNKIAIDTWADANVVVINGGVSSQNGGINLVPTASVILINASVNAAQTAINANAGFAELVNATLSSASGTILNASASTIYGGVIAGSDGDFNIKSSKATFWMLDASHQNNLNLFASNLTAYNALELPDGGINLDAGSNVKAADVNANNVFVENKSSITADRVSLNDVQVHNGSAVSFGSGNVASINVAQASSGSLSNLTVNSNATVTLSSALNVYSTTFEMGSSLSTRDYSTTMIDTDSVLNDLAIDVCNGLTFLPEGSEHFVDDCNQQF